MMDGSVLIVAETASPQITIRNCVNISGNLTVMLSPRNRTGTNKSVVVMDAGCFNGSFRDVNLVFKEGSQSCVDANYSRQEIFESRLTVYFDLSSTNAAGCNEGISESSCLHISLCSLLFCCIYALLLIMTNS